MTETEATLSEQDKVFAIYVVTVWCNKNQIYHEVTRNRGSNWRERLKGFRGRSKHYICHVSDDITNDVKFITTLVTLFEVHKAFELGQKHTETAFQVGFSGLNLIGEWK